MYCRLLTHYAIVMVQFLAGLRKIKLHAAHQKGETLQLGAILDIDDNIQKNNKRNNKNFRSFLNVNVNALFNSDA